MKLALPEELQFDYKGKLYTEIEAKDFVSRSIQQKLAKAQRSENDLAANDMILLNCIDTPKFTQQYLDGDNYDAGKLSLIAVSLMDLYNMTPDRINAVKKKVRKL